MRKLGQFDPEKRRRSLAVMLHGGRHFLQGPRGGPGAIAILEDPGQSGFRQAQRYRDQALEWVVVILAFRRRTAAA